MPYIVGLVILFFSIFYFWKSMLLIMLFIASLALLSYKPKEDSKISKRAAKTWGGICLVSLFIILYLDHKPFYKEEVYEYTASNQNEEIDSEPRQTSGYAGCISEQAYREFTQAAVSKDYTGVNHLLISGLCKDLTGMYLEPVEKGFSKSKVRASDGRLYWVANEAL